MKMPVYVLLIIDPTTNKLQPIACNESLWLIEQTLVETRDNLEMSMAFVAAENRAAVKAGANSLRIERGTLDVPDARLEPDIG